jgi:hypothetical protein
VERLRQKIDVVVLVIDMNTFKKMLFHKLTDEMVHVVDVSTLFGDVDRIGEIECRCIVREEVEWIQLLESKLIRDIALVDELFGCEAEDNIL